MIELVAILLGEVGCLSALAWEDHKTMHIAFSHGIVIVAIMVLLLAFELIVIPKIAAILLMLGLIMFAVLSITGLFRIQQIRMFDRVVYAMTLMTFPFVSMGAIAIQQLGMVVMAKQSKEPRKIPMLPVYAGGFIISALILSLVLGIGSFYL